MKERPPQYTARHSAQLAMLLRAALSEPLERPGADVGASLDSTSPARPVGGAPAAAALVGSGRHRAHI